MDLPSEIRCEACGRLYATLVPQDNGGFLLNVLPPGMPIRPVSLAERLGQLFCACGHRTPVDLAVVGQP